ncbi:hypothetical protein E4T66_17200 [Sinimarinibacterium sp. CAU 1509]|uniref:hypothetical protein n=1 Tax=Sinimarinibacterium sp. CAU 1509 TaxID=2562283 RepID=UPI0010AB9988|nr:hypothetical protein [Sinimarinibacterium sp. CAU 1509]TJY57148.1 hypothetical protein E4T66_17200 [Sinimarinibacterium sp. CAU 1509]
MSKQILPAHLAAIVSTLLTDPQALGELDSEDTFLRFFEAIGQVVADHCGGTINGVSPALCPGSVEADGQPMLSVSPSESLPSMTENVWAPYDPEGWADARTSESDAQ